MTAVRYWFRAELRRVAWPALSLVLVVGLGAGLALAAFAAARRTTSAYPRMLEATEAPDVLVNPDFGSFSRLDPDAVIALPGVERGGVLHGLLAVPSGRDGAPDLEGNVFVGATEGDLGTSFGRPLVREGRMPAPERADEMLVNERFADARHVGVGDRFPLLITTFDALEASDAAGEPPDFDRVELAITGIGMQPDEAEVDEAFHQERVTLTPAFFARHRGSEAFWGAAVRLLPGASLHDFQTSVQAMVDDESIAFQSTDRDLDKFQRGVRPQATALSVFGLVLGVAVLAVALLGVVRQHAALGPDRANARVLGASRRQAELLGLLHGGVLAAASAVVAVSVAGAVSRYAPPEPARTVEIDRGVSFDGPVLVSGAAVVAIAILAAAVVTVRRSTAPSRHGPPRRSRVASRLRRTGAPLAAVVGAQLAFERGEGRAATPVWSSLVGIAVGVAVVAGSFVFAASLDRVESTPSLYGTTWDAAVFLSLPEEDSSGTAAAFDRIVADAAAVLRSRPGIEGLSELTFGQVGLGGRTTPALGIRPLEGDVAPPVVEGHPPAGDREVALGRRTLERLGARVGDDVEIGGKTFRIVGQAVFPGYAEYPGQDKTELGDGVLVTAAGLRSVGPVIASRTILVDAADGADVRRALAGVELEGSTPESPISYDTYRPAEIVTLARVRDTPSRLAVVLGLVGFALLAHTLVSSVRRRRGVLALLAVLGFTRGQVRNVVLSQATLVGAFAVGFGLPVGLVIGRWTWTFLIERLGGIVAVVVPSAELVALAAVVLVAANVVAAVPARLASRVRPAVALRSE